VDDLIYILENQQLSPYEIVELLNEVLNNYNEYKVRLEDYAIKNRICPKCLRDLEIHEWKESRGEYQGYLASEIMNELYCERCGIRFPILE
jgi:uncharacterized protein YbaR (Trm112 family)